MRVRERHAVIIAGPNGSGKSTLTEDPVEFRIALPDTRINPDVILRQLERDHPDTPKSELEKRAFSDARELRQSCCRNGTSFMLETVFSHASNLAFLEQLRTSGFEITLVLVLTEDPRINVERVARRVASGGHSVPVTKVHLRYYRLMKMLPLAVEAVDHVLVFDTSHEDRVRLCYERSGVLEVLDNPPAYVDKCLIGAMAERTRQRQELEERHSGPQVTASLLEAVYVGPIIELTSHYLLQSIEPGGLVLHNRVSLPGVLADLIPGGSMKIKYIEGMATFEPLLFTEIP